MLNDAQNRLNGRYPSITVWMAPGAKRMRSTAGAGGGVGVGGRAVAVGVGVTVSVAVALSDGGVGVALGGVAGGILFRKAARSNTFQIT